MTYAVAMAASKDAGNRHARAAGRTSWSVEDYNASVTEFDRLYPLEAQLTDEGHLPLGHK